MGEDLFKKLNPGQQLPAGCREVPGHIPHSYAKIHLYDPNKISQLQKREAEYKKVLRREEINDYVLENERRHGYGVWRAASDKKVLGNNVKRDVEYLLAQRDEYLEERRDRIKQLFEEEEEKYMRELEQQGETPERRYARMMKQLSVLQTQKEEERLKVVKEKYDQRWRETCPGLREIISKKICQEVTYERDEQLLHQEVIKQQKKEQERMFAECYKADCEAKFEKIRIEEENVKRNALECALVQSAQYHESQVKSKELENLKKEEAALMAQQRELMELEAKWEIINKNNKIQKVRRGLDKCIVIKNKFDKEQKEREDLLDQFYLALGRAVNMEEIREVSEKKKELKHQQQEFMRYVLKVKQEEAQRELEIEKSSKIENDKMWEARQKQWAIEKEAREKLMWEAYHGIMAQIKCNLKLLDERRLEIQRERIEMDQKVAEYRREEAEKMRKWKEAQLHYQDELLTQIDEEQRLVREKVAEKKLEWEKCREEEEKYLKIMKSVREDPLAAIVTHPCRRNKFHIPINR